MRPQLLARTQLEVWGQGLEVWSQQTQLVLHLVVVVVIGISWKPGWTFWWHHCEDCWTSGAEERVCLAGHTCGTPGLDSNQLTFKGRVWLPRSKIKGISRSSGFIWAPTWLQMVTLKQVAAFLRKFCCEKEALWPHVGCCYMTLTLWNHSDAEPSGEHEYGQWLVHSCVANVNRESCSPVDTCIAFLWCYEKETLKIPWSHQLSMWVFLNAGWWATQVLVIIGLTCQ